MYGPRLNYGCSATSKEGIAKYRFPLPLVNKSKSGFSVSIAQVKSVQGDSVHWLQSHDTGRMSLWEPEGSDLSEKTVLSGQLLQILKWKNWQE